VRHNQCADKPHGGASSMAAGAFRRSSSK
jgi:hypothetical protein